MPKTLQRDDAPEMLLIVLKCDAQSSVLIGERFYVSYKSLLLFLPPSTIGSVLSSLSSV